MDCGSARPLGILSRILVALRRRGPVSPAVFLVPLLLTGCAGRDETAASIAAGGGLIAGQWAARDFDIRVFTRLRPGAPTLTIYLEGDGYAWITATRVSDDPTPKDPTALRMAAADPSPSVAYIARPCQFTKGAARRNCAAPFWTDGRYAPAIVDAVDEAVTALRDRAGASRLRLIGYSGGGAIAAILAARHPETEMLITVAGVLDTEAWTRADNLPPLSGSINPAELTPMLKAVPQIHLVGARDDVVYPLVAQAYARRYPEDRRPRIVTMPDFDHVCCWAEQWPSLLSRLTVK